MRRTTLVSACTAAFAAGALIAAGFAPAPAALASASGLSSPSSVSLPITGYYQMAVDSADDQVFISQGTAGGNSIVVVNFPGNVVAPSPSRARSPVSR